MINKRYINQTFKDIYNAVDAMEASINEQRAEIKRLRHVEEIDQLLIKELLGINEQLRKDSYEANGISLKYEDRYFVALVELDEARRERDEARRQVCDWYNTDESGCVKSGSHETARARGWDCFKETP